jgi:hypothetical protein
VRRHLLAVLAAFMMLAAGTGVAVAKAPPRLSALGPTSVSGTEKTAVFQIGGRTIRQVRYRDTATLVYSFTLRNDGQLPLSVTGLAPLENQPQLFHYLGITDAQGHKRFTVGAGKDTPVRLSMRMQSCETLSARAGSFATEANLRTSRVGVLDAVVHVLLPEEVHTGSPREAFCPNSTATSRPPG